LKASVKVYAYIAIGILLAATSILFFLWSISFMQRSYVATSLLSALIGFSTLSASLYLFRLSAYVYGVEKGVSGEEGS